MFDQDEDFYLITLNILSTFLLDSIWIIIGRGYMLVTSGR